MELVLREWVSLGIRWLHVIAGIAWIGSSFYFVHLDLSLQKRAALPKEAYGEAWQVHGGGFYNMVKYLVAPAQLPDELTWFKWEAYTTWLSGFALLVFVYYLGAGLYLVDRNVMDLAPLTAVGISLGGLIAGWLVYDGLCRSPLGRNDNALAAVGFVFLVALCLGFSHLLSGRGTFLQMGALIGTMMVANVFVIIIPNQKKVVAALLAGQTPDPALGAEAKQRSLHNNYLTLPVIFVMISNHYPLVFATRYNWLIFAIVLVLGAVIRHFFNSRHAGKPSPWWTWIIAALGMAAITWLSYAGSNFAKADSAAASFDKVVDIVTTRCSMCHAAEPVWEGIGVAPKGILLDSPEAITRHARQIEINAVRTHAMPPGNITEITDEERGTLAAWLDSGAALH